MDQTALSDERRTAIFAHLDTYIRRQRDRNRRLVLASLGLVTVAALSAAAWVVTAPQEVQQRQVWCYSASNLDSTLLHLDLASEDTIRNVTETALDGCATFWRVGALSTGDTATPATSGEGDLPVPPLVACQRTDLTLAVFPSGDTPPVTDARFCDALGLMAAPHQ